MSFADRMIVVTSLIAAPGVLFSIWVVLRCQMTRRWTRTPALLTEARFVTPRWVQGTGGYHGSLIPRMRYTYDVNGERLTGRRFSACDLVYFGEPYVRALLKTTDGQACPTEIEIAVHPRRPDRAVMRPGLHSLHVIWILGANMTLPLPALAIYLKFL